MRIGSGGLELDDHGLEGLIGEVLLHITGGLEMTNPSRAYGGFLPGLARLGQPFVSASQKDHHRLGCFVQWYILAPAELQPPPTNPAILEFPVAMIQRKADRVLARWT